MAIANFFQRVLIKRNIGEWAGEEITQAKARTEFGQECGRVRVGLD